jgi:apolipoprotein N-acyltransferase
VSTVGVSALIAPDGRVLERSSLFTPAVLQAALPLRTQLTLATRLGEWPEALLTVLGLGLLVLGASRNRRRRTGARLGASPVESSDASTNVDVVTSEVR